MGEQAKYKVLLTTSGIGSRLGDLTKYTNKSLVRIGKKPALSYIVEAYPQDVEIVVTLGHFSSHVKDFLELAYPARKFTFINVDKYEGPGSSLGYSILQAKSAIDCPFVFHACDTVVKDPIPEPSKNWLGGFKAKSSTHYRSLDVSMGHVTKINEKGELNYDYDYIGLAGIFNYAEFFAAIEEIYIQNPMNHQMSDCDALTKMLAAHRFFHQIFHYWYDIGNSDSLKTARDSIDDKFDVLDKLEESIFLFDDCVIKFFHDKNICANRVERAKLLKGIVPNVLDSRENFYKYEFIKGDLFADSCTESKFRDFLRWSQANLWVRKQDRNSAFYERCHDFYFTKTYKRIDKFLKDNAMSDQETKINGELVPPLNSLLKRVDEKWLCNVDAYQFHGDYILDNIIETESSFVLLDWRQDFGGQLELGDIYYDLAKLNHNLVFNHDIVNRNLYEIKVGEDISCDILRSHVLVNCQNILFEAISGSRLDLKKVKVITALVWLNMAPLHHYPLNHFLFYFGKLNLHHALMEATC